MAKKSNPLYALLVLAFSAFIFFFPWGSGETLAIPRWWAFCGWSGTVAASNLLRILGGVAGIATAFALYGVGCRLFGDAKRAFFAAMVLLTFSGVAHMPLLTAIGLAAMLASLACMVRALQTNGPAMGRLLFGGVLCGVSIFLAGPSAFVGLGFSLFIGQVLYGRPYMKGKWGALLLGLLLALLIGFWWVPVGYIGGHGAEVRAALAWEGVGVWYGNWTFLPASGLWWMMLVAVLLAPLYSSLARDSHGFMTAWSWSILSLVLLSILPLRGGVHALPLLFPLALAAGELLCLWAEAFKGKYKRKADWYVLIGVAVAMIATLVILLVKLLVDYGAGFSMLTKMLMLATALGVAMLLGSAAWRKMPVDLIIGMVLYTVVWKLLAVPELDYFL